MEISEDYRDLFKILNAHKIRYLIVGAYAVSFYTEPRFTKDIDVWVKPDIDNAKKLYNALVAFGAPLKEVKIEDFTNEKTVYQIGVAPVRIDIIMGLGDLKFDKTWKSHVKTKYGGISVQMIGKNDLIHSKDLAKRSQDTLDLKKLTREKK
ncbi:MAG: nucleotidyltransferase [Candidatus Omnitrophica bacterium]|nr:nucleotidyltransferase [Candidatus Omnitrophota bacterium]